MKRVSGYLDKTGKFHDTKINCRYANACYDYMTLLRKEQLSIDHYFRFTKTNWETISEFIDAWLQLSTAQESQKNVTGNNTDPIPTPSSQQSTSAQCGESSTTD